MTARGKYRQKTAGVLLADPEGGQGLRDAPLYAWRESAQRDIV